jgi:hypothetical protein
MFAVIKTVVTDISAFTGRNDFIFDKPGKGRHGTSHYDKVMYQK